MGFTLGTAGNNGAAGWSVFTVSSNGSGEGSGYSGTGTRIIYVDSAAANDSGTGSLASPKKTIAAGIALLRDGKPDWLLLKKGGTWREHLNGATGFFPVSGQDASNYMLISSYGTGARPILELPNDVSGFFPASAKGDFVALVGLKFYEYTSDISHPNYIAFTAGNYPIFHVQQFTKFLIEDCNFDYGHTLNIATNYLVGLGGNGTRTGDCYFRRNILRHFWSVGMLMGNVSTTRIDECLFDSNCEDLNANNHNIYLQDTMGPVTIQNIISTRSSYNAVKSRGGAHLRNSFLGMTGQLCEWFGDAEEGTPAGHLTDLFQIHDNVFSRARHVNRITEAGGGGGGFATVGTDTTNRVDVQRNIISNVDYPLDGGHRWAILFSQFQRNSFANANRIYNWNTLGVTQEPSVDGTIDFTGNFIDADANGNLDGGSTPHGWPHPERTLADYGAFMGITATEDAVLAECALQSKDNWRPAYTAPAINDFFRTQFGMTTLGVDPGDAGGVAAVVVHRAKVKLR